VQLLLGTTGDTEAVDAVKTRTSLQEYAPWTYIVNINACIVIVGAILVLVVFQFVF
jgi:hypothetical protein